jgi:hypothetical protein
MLAMSYMGKLESVLINTQQEIQQRKVLSTCGLGLGTLGVNCCYKPQNKEGERKRTRNGAILWLLCFSCEIVVKNKQRKAKSLCEFYATKPIIIPQKL